MGMMGSEDARRELASIYASSTDKDVKRAILQAFMISGSREFLLNAAKTEKDPDLRREAIHELGISGGQDELWQLYQSEASVEAKEDILKSMFVGGNSAHLIDVARSEKDPRLRLAAIKSLGVMGDNGRGDVLVSIYHSDQDRAIREAILNALFIQQNGKALVDLARNEQDPADEESDHQQARPGSLQRDYGLHAGDSEMRTLALLFAVSAGACAQDSEAGCNQRALRDPGIFGRSRCADSGGIRHLVRLRRQDHST